MTDIIERAEFALSAVDDYGLIDPLMMATRDLIAELKAARAENEQLEQDVLYWQCKAYDAEDGR